MYDEKKKNVEASDSHIYLIIGLAYSVSDERIAMTRNHAISLPQHPPGDHQASRNRQTLQIQRSALQRLANSPPSLRHQLATAF